MKERFAKQMVRSSASLRNRQIDHKSQMRSVQENGERLSKKINMMLQISAAKREGVIRYLQRSDAIRVSILECSF